ncbi:MAG: CDP-alcohol phosphatidyltransferase family protein [Acidobacteriota bacterium]
MEETLDVVFYRPCGSVIASAAARLHMTPNQLTAFGAAVGIIGGHFLFYRSVTLNLMGIALILAAEMIDSADGQLARMTNQFTKYGRFLDGFGDNLKFVSIYVHCALRFSAAVGMVPAFAVALIAGVSHSYQSAAADYYRTAFLGFALKKSRKDLKTTAELSTNNAQLTWRRHPLEKLFLRLWLNNTYQQEMMSRSFILLNTEASNRWNGTLPDSFSAEYYERNLPLIKYYNILTTNTRMAVLFVAVLADVIPLYFAFEIVVLNLLLAAVLLRQSAINRTLHEKIIDGVYT